jgi:hypothetical protein
LVINTIEDIHIKNLKIRVLLECKLMTDATYRCLSKEKVQFTPSNYHKSSIFILQLQNRITEAIQLS